MGVQLQSLVFPEIARWLSYPLCLLDVRFCQGCQVFFGSASTTSYKAFRFLSVMNRLWVGLIHNVVCEDGKLGSVVEVFLSHRWTRIDAVGTSSSTGGSFCQWQFVQPFSIAPCTRVLLTHLLCRKAQGQTLWRYDLQLQIQEHIFNYHCQTFFSSILQLFQFEYSYCVKLNGICHNYKFCSMCIDSLFEGYVWSPVPSHMDVFELSLYHPL